MNKIFKVIYSKTRHCYVVVSELAKSHCKTAGSHTTRNKTALTAAVLLALGTFSFLGATSVAQADGTQSLRNNDFVGANEYYWYFDEKTNTWTKYPYWGSDAFNNRSREKVPNYLGGGAKEPGSFAGGLYAQAGQETITIGDRNAGQSKGSVFIGEQGKYNDGGDNNPSEESMHNNYVTAVGFRSNATGWGSIAIGSNAVAENTQETSQVVDYEGSAGTSGTVKDDVYGIKLKPEIKWSSVALGYNAHAKDGNIAIGADSEATDTSSDTPYVSVGNSTLQRRITNVADGTNPSDVATFGQLQDLSAKVGVYDAGFGIKIDSDTNKKKNTISVKHNLSSGNSAYADTDATGLILGGSMKNRNAAKQYGAATASSVIVGAQNALASNENSVVIGGLDNVASGANSTVVGGDNNKASGNQSAVFGGRDNTASGITSTASGGIMNVANGQNSTAVGGTFNYALGTGATSVGGYGKDYTTGYNSSVNGSYSVGIAGGSTGDKADYSLAAGRQAVVTTENGTAIGYQATTDEANTIAFGHDKGDVSGYTVTWEQLPNGQTNADGTSNDYTKAPTVKKTTYDSAAYNRLVKVADGVEDHDVVVMEQLKNASNVGNNIKVYKTDENGNVQFDENNKPIEDTSDAAKTAQNGSKVAWGQALGAGTFTTGTSDKATNASTSDQLVTGKTLYNYDAPSGTDLKYVSANNTTGQNLEALDSALKTVSTTAGAHTALTVEGNTPAGTGKDAKTNEDVYTGENILLHESKDETTGKVTYDMKLSKDIVLGDTTHGNGGSLNVYSDTTEGNNLSNHVSINGSTISVNYKNKAGSDTRGVILGVGEEDSKPDGYIAFNNVEGGYTYLHASTDASDDKKGRLEYAGNDGNKKYVANLDDVSTAVNNAKTKYYSVNDSVNDKEPLPKLVGYSNESNDGAKGMGSIAAGFNTHADGIASTVAGSYSGVINTGDVKLMGYDFRGATALSYGTFNVNQSTAQSGVFSGVANSIVGQANATTDSNAAIIYGAGNTVTNSYRAIDPSKFDLSKVKQDIAKKDAAAVAKDLQEAVPTSGGQVMVMGGGNSVDKAYMTQVTGVGNKVTGTQTWSDEEKADNSGVTQLNFIDGFYSSLENGHNDYMIGAYNKLKDSDSTIIFGDNNGQKFFASSNDLKPQKDNINFVNVKDSIAIGSNNNFISKADKAHGSLEDVVAVGNNNTVSGSSHAIAIGDQNTIHNGEAWQGDPKSINSSGNVAIGYNTKIWYDATYGSDGESIVIGKNASAYNPVGTLEKTFNFGNEDLKNQKSGFTGSIAIGENAFARSGSTTIGVHRYKGTLGDINVDPTSTPSGYSGNNGVGNSMLSSNATTVGNETYNNGVFSTAMGSYTSLSGLYSHQKWGEKYYGLQNFGAAVIGSLDSVESLTSTQGTAGMADSILGSANRTQNANGTVMVGAGNVVTNSAVEFGADEIKTASSENPNKLSEAMRTSIKNANGGGAASVIGNGNIVDSSTSVSVVGAKNEVYNTKNAQILASNRTIGTKTPDTTSTGDATIKVKPVENSVIIGSASVDSPVTTTNSNVTILGYNANAEVDDGVAIGSGSVASTVAGVAGYDPTTGKDSTKDTAAWKATNAAVSIGKADGTVTRQINGVAAGTKETDAVNVAQLKSLQSGLTNDLTNKGLTFATNSGKTTAKLGDTVTIQGTAKKENHEYTADNLTTEIDESGNITILMDKDMSTETLAVNGKDGKDGNPGTAGSIGINGKDGQAGIGIDGKDGISIKGTDGKDGVTIKVDNGKDGKAGSEGHIGLTGRDGSSADIIVKKGYDDTDKGINGTNGVDGKDGITRIVYTDKTGEHQVATMEDGLKFKGDDTTVIAKKLNNTLDIIGGADSKNLTEGNIGVNSTKDHQLKVQLAKDLKGITSISNQKTEGDKTTGAKIDLGTDGSVNVNGGKITNVGSGADASGKYTTTTNAANIGDVQKIVKDAVDSASDTTNKALAGKANIDASNIGANLKGADGEAASAEDQKTNAENWGSAIGTGEIKADDGRMVTGKTVYDEVRPAEDGSYVKKDKTTGENLSALDSKIGKLDETKKYNYIDSKSTTSISDNLGKLDTQVKKNADDITHINQSISTLDQNAVKYDDSSKSKVTLGGGENGTTITNVKDGSVAKDSKEAVNGGQLYEVNENVTNNTNEITKIKEGDFTDTSKTVIKNLAKDAVQVKAGDRIRVDEATDEKTGNKTYKISANNNGTVAKGDGNLISGNTLYKEVHVDKDGTYIKSKDSATGKDMTVAQNLSALDTGLKTTSDLIHTNDKGDTIQIGGNSTATKIDVSGKDGKGNTTGRVITGVVSDANDPNSAANVGYVNGLTAANTQQIYRDMNNAYSRLDTNINRAAAGSNALAALHPLDYDPADKASFAVGYGHYHNANAAAVGAFYQPNANTMVNMGISLGNGDPGFNAGVSFKIGKGSAYNGVSKAEMAQTIHDQAAEISTIKANDAAKDKRIDALEKENQEMKKQIQEILARLNG